MKTLKCEMCGSVDLVKQDGLFVCQYCGTKYSLEEARKMMIEGTVVVDKSPEVLNLIKRIFSFWKKGKFLRAKKYSQKILDIDARNEFASIVSEMDLDDYDEMEWDSEAEYEYEYEMFCVLWETQEYQEIRKLQDDSVKKNVEEFETPYNIEADYIYSKEQAFICYYGKEKSFKIPDGVTSIGSGAFSGCDSLTSVEIGESVTLIGWYAFDGCSSLTSVTFKNPNGWFYGSSAISTASLSQPSTAAEYLRGTCVDDVWKRS